MTGGRIDSMPFRRVSRRRPVARLAAADRLFWLPSRLLGTLRGIRGSVLRDAGRVLRPANDNGVALERRAANCNVPRRLA